MAGEHPSTPVWSSRMAFYLATIGAAVGLGSIWRLPYLVGSSGGSAFIVVFVIACLVVATPLLVAEFAIGRRSRRSPPAAAGAVAAESGLSRYWNLIGILGTISSFMVISYYTVIAAWVMAYSWKSGIGLLEGKSRSEIGTMWQGFLADPLVMAAWHFAFVLMVCVISARGVGKGIEWASRLRAPLLLLLLLILTVYSLLVGDVERGLQFAFAPDFSAITPAVVLAAVGQAFYATGVGMAMMLAYGSYVEKGTSLVRSALGISASILLVSLLATIIIFPLVFHYGMDPAQGPELVFDVLATAFAEMPGGRLFGTLFFLLLVLAALTPSIAGLEPVVAWLQQQGGLTRARAAVLACGLAWLVGIGTVLSFNLWSAWRPLAFVPSLAQMTFFEAMDYLGGSILLLIGAFFTSLFFGWRLSRTIVAEELDATTPLARQVCVWLLRYLCPIAILAIFVSVIL